jgi:hypothetical protein
MSWPFILDLGPEIDTAQEVFFNKNTAQKSVRAPCGAVRAACAQDGDHRRRDLNGDGHQLIPW